MSTEPFSLLLCVCGLDDLNHFFVALDSVTTNQKVKPTEIVLVIDGPVEVGLEEHIHASLKTAGLEYILIKNSTRRGLAFSLNRGLERCSYGWVARMDADDIAMPERFEIQMEHLSRFPHLAVLGSSVCEFDSNGHERDKVVLTSPGKINQRLPFRNPMNHPTCVLNREKVLRVGGYPLFAKNQDYGLWLRLAAEGFELANRPEVLLKFRIGNNFYGKRGWQLFKYDVEVIRLSIELRMVSYFTGLILVLSRFVLRMLPTQFLRLAYLLSRR